MAVKTYEVKVCDVCEQEKDTHGFKVGRAGTRADHMKNVDLCDDCRPAMDKLVAMKNPAPRKPRGLTMAFSDSVAS